MQSMVCGLPSAAAIEVLAVHEQLYQVITSFNELLVE
jgi:hypothetical protein